MGDFNAHIGKKDLTTSDRTLIGPNLLHDLCNPNGEEMKILLHVGHFSVKNTWSLNPSLTYTWSSPNSKSQIHHLLSNSTELKWSKIFATWVATLKTDHNLVSGIVSYQQQQTTKRPNSQLPTTGPRELIWRLGNPVRA